MSELSTQLIHHPYRPPVGFSSPQPPVFRASTVIFPDVATMRTTDWKRREGYTYGLHGTPGTFLLEERLCALEGGLQCLLAPSGLAAISTVSLALLRSGDEVLIPDNSYGPNKALAENELRGWGITHRYYDSQDAQDLAAKISPATRLVWLEAAGSVTLEFPDLVALVRVCQARSVLTALDNTWGAGLAFRPFDLLAGSGEALAVDLTVHALTKYPSGGGDVLMGSIITCDPQLHLRLRATRRHLGMGVSGNDVETVLRGLASIELRYRHHDMAARSLAQWASTRPEFAQVLHPALPDSPGHDFWRAVCKQGAGGAAGLFSVIFGPQHSVERVDAFCNALCLFKLGYSWGGPMSLVVPYKISEMRSQHPAYLKSGTVVRFSVGLEDVADLQADLEQALRQALF
ncbi:MAG: PLP-dependent transferase [Burkholderiaceae bacterium]